MGSWQGTDILKAFLFSNISPVPRRKSSTYRPHPVKRPPPEEEPEAIAMYDTGEPEGPAPSDHEELVHGDEIGSSTDSEDTPMTCSAHVSIDQLETASACSSNEGQGPTPPPSGFPLLNTIDFCLTGLALSVSSTTLMIGYPVYLSSVVSISNSFVALFFPSTATFITLLLIVLLLKAIGYLNDFSFTQCPLPIKRLVFGAMSFAVGASIIVLSHQPGRVPCHLQDPLKAVIIIYALLYYFFFCKKMLGLRKLFAASVLAVGLFIAADYGLCDEFKCRGNVYHSEGSWQIRTCWSILYLIGLALFTLHFTIAEENLANRTTDAAELSLANTFLDTVSRLVAQSEAIDQATNDVEANIAAALNINTSSPRTTNHRIPTTKQICIMTTLWIQGITWMFLVTTGVILMTMTYSLDIYVTSDSLLNITATGLECHKPFMSWTPYHSVNTLPNFNGAENGPTIPAGYSSNSDENIKTNIYNYNKKQPPVDTTHDLSIGKRMDIMRRMMGTTKGHQNQKPLKHFGHLIKYKTIDFKENSNTWMTIKRLKMMNRNEKTTKESNITGQKDRENDKNNSYKDSKKRSKRSAVDLFPYGFKVVHPTISMLKDHKITSKIQHYLIGHTILNMSDANIKGHKIKAANKQDSILYHAIDLNKWKHKIEKEHKTHLEKKTSKKHKIWRIKRFVNGEIPKILTEYAAKLEKLNKTRKEAANMQYKNQVDSNVVYEITTHESTHCNYISTYGWTVYISYTVFSISSIRFLKLCQSSVFTIAMMTPALPLTGIWWAVFTYGPDGTLMIEPNLSGELICALLSLPIILLGLLLLFKAQLYQPLCSTLDEERTEDYFIVMQQGLDLNKINNNDNGEYELQGRTDALAI